VDIRRYVLWKQTRTGKIDAHPDAVKNVAVRPLLGSSGNNVKETGGDGVGHEYLLNWVTPDLDFDVAIVRLYSLPQRAGPPDLHVQRARKQTRLAQTYFVQPDALIGSTSHVFSIQQYQWPSFKHQARPPSIRG
jgi:hypothetical protein